ncbi:MAG TPA: hypothetical protein VMH81_22335 [Bryobacteraceae bacterium]|nr:hypothetical protein [Bryobacteraceae bacterium]
MRIAQRVTVSFALGAMLLAPLALLAQYRHPRYLRARSDLRRAVILMRLPDEPNVMRDMQEASGLVERAIHELDVAAAFDRRDLVDNPPVDTRLGRGSRFREILRLIETARADIAQEEDNRYAREWSNRAFGYLDSAVAFVRKGGYDRFRDEAALPPPPPPPPPAPVAVHPRYLHAISDLRYARALLFRQDWRDIMRNQRAAVDEIDRAIGAARAAAVDDGRNPNDTPPVDRRLGWADRFTKALELLNSAERDLSFAEDNRAASGWRAAALVNVANAKRFVARAQTETFWR